MTRLLLTRPAADSEALATALNHEGIDTLISPVIHIRPLRVPALPTSAQALVITSRHALFAAQGLALPCYVVGQQTAELARALGLSVAKSAPTAESLEPFLPQDMHLLYLSGENISYDFGHPHLTRVAVYAAAAAEELPALVVTALQTAQITGVVFYSARSAGIFHALLHKHGIGNSITTAVAYCISAAVAQECDQSLWHRIAIAPQPDTPAMLTLLRQEK